VAGTLIISFATAPARLINSPVFHFAGATTYILTNVNTIKIGCCIHDHDLDDCGLHWICTTLVGDTWIPTVAVSIVRELLPELELRRFSAMGASAEYLHFLRRYLRSS
jgi:hypothetical protein